MGRSKQPARELADDCRIHDPDSWEAQARKDREYLECFSALDPEVAKLIGPPEPAKYATGKPAECSVEALEATLTAPDVTETDETRRLISEAAANLDHKRASEWAFAPISGRHGAGFRKALIRCAAIFITIHGAGALSERDESAAARRLGIGRRHLQKIKQDLRKAIPGAVLFTCRKKY